MRFDDNEDQQCQKEHRHEQKMKNKIKILTIKNNIIDYYFRFFLCFQIYTKQTKFGRLRVLNSDIFYSNLM